MREDSVKIEIKLLTTELWKSITILRGVLPVEHHHVYLFLLSAYYDGIIKRDFLHWGKDSHEFIHRAFETNSKYSELLDVYLPIIDNIPEEKLGSLLTFFSMFIFNIQENNFNEVFDNLLFRIADAQGKYSGEFLLPNEISRFVIDVAEVHQSARVFNPFAGLASFATHLSNKEHYYGQEISQSTWALGKLRLMRQQRNVDIDYRIEDSIHNWPESNSFDLVIANPPFNFKIDRWFADYDYNRSRMTAEQYVLKRGLESINNDGKVICVASQGTLFKGGAEGRYRQQLIEKGLIDTVISLPGGLLKHTGIAICILILRKTINNDRVIRFVNGKNFVIDNGRRDKRLDNDKLLAYLNSTNNHEFVRIVDIKTLEENDYNLSVQRYFVDEIKGVCLKQVVKIVIGLQTKERNFGKFIRTSNLKDDDAVYTLNINEVEDRELPAHSKKIETSCILVSIRWKSLKPTLFKYSGIPIYIGTDILALKVQNENIIIDPNYLITELRSSAVINQIAAYQNTGAIPFIKRSDLLEIKIKVPSIEEQKGKIKGILELSQKFEALQNERNALAHGQKVTIFDEFASLKHSLGAPRQNILSNAKSLIRFFESSDTPGFNEVKKSYSDRYKTNLLDDLVQIKEDINHISAILEKGEKGLFLENYELKPTPVKDINQLLKGLKSSREKFTLHFEKASNDEIKGKAILANITLFQILLDNVLSNTNKYAFKEAKGLNLMVIELRVTEEVMQLEIRNNGEPFPKNYDKSKFIQKYSTANPEKGTGMGGYDINRIAKYFKSEDWELDLNNDTPFPVIFKFNFPIIPILNE
ncbi:N-6 DNA methylase [Confluentibacter citreus]|uniref:N-6 DNA methylase n=1 Tax=Confluentibacter citreus TaxID=2007307 RepID=UPI000C294E3D|nr:N-6 DNA methylase [Confluentibacter citreus]